MTVDWMAFTPFSALGGGALIGLAAALMILLNGRVAGISGILGGVLRATAAEVGWRVAFIGGLLVAPLLLGLLFEPSAPQIDASLGVLVVAGLLVGVGTRLGSGCTSGHGVCGVARLSPRSLTATLCFMAAGFATVYLVRHVLGGEG